MRSAAAGAAVLSVGLLLSACGGGDDGPDVLPPITSTPSVTSAAPTPSVSVFPETPQGAAAFARFVYGEIDRAYAAKDPGVLRPLFLNSCKACANFVDTVASLRDDALTVKGGTSQILSAETPGGQSGDTEVSVRAAFEGIVITDARGQEVLRQGPGEVQSSVVLRRSGASWLVVEIVTAS